MPAYNVEPYIEEAIKSVLNQTILPLELIIINDGSTDGTADVIAKYTDNPIVKVITIKNRGLGPARNLGMEHAQGEYIYFFDSDDLLAPYFIAEMNAIIESNNLPDAVFFSAECFEKKPGDLPEHEKNNYLTRKASSQCSTNVELIENLHSHKDFCVCAWSYVSKKEIWITNKLKFKPIIHEDVPSYYEMLLHINTSTIIQNTMYYYRMRPNSITNSGVTMKRLYSYKQIAIELLHIRKSCGSQNLFLFSNVLLEKSTYYMKQYISTSRQLQKKIKYIPLLRSAIKTKNFKYLYTTIFNLLPLGFQHALKKIKLFLRALNTDK